MKVQAPLWMHEQMDALAEWRTEELKRQGHTGRVRRSEVVRETISMGLVMLQTRLEGAKIEVPGFDPRGAVLRNGR